LGKDSLPFPAWVRLTDDRRLSIISIRFVGPPWRPVNCSQRSRMIGVTETLGVMNAISTWRFFYGDLPWMHLNSSHQMAN
jgi:hypothetical protein